MLLTAASRDSPVSFHQNPPSLLPKVCNDSTSSSSRTDSISTLEVKRAIRTLELDRVKEIFQRYDTIETSGAVACVICGKTYKSKVCVKKHLWEHSVYWDLFDGLKKQQRVLSIQAALILAVKFNPSLSLLVVTQSSNNVKKNKSEKNENNYKSQNNNNVENRQSSSNVTDCNDNKNFISRKRKIEEPISEGKNSFTKIENDLNNSSSNISSVFSSSEVQSASQYTSQHLDDIHPKVSYFSKQS